MKRKWARIGPRNRHWLIDTPKACLCLSTFVIVRSRSNRILLYRPKEHRAWPVVGGQPVWTSKVWEKSNRWFLPGTHLMMEEDPEKAAKRITKEFFGLECSNPSQLKIQSHLRPSSRWKWMKAPKGTKHWDICFVYETRLKKLPKEKRPWHKDLKMVRLSEIGRKFKMGEHIDILRKAGYV